MEAFFGTASDHYIGITVSDHPASHTDGMGTCGTCGRHGDVRPLQTFHDGKMTGHHIDDGGRNEEGTDLAWAAVDQAFVVLFNQTQTADTGANRHADTFGILFIDGQAGIIQRLHTGRDAVLNEEIHLASVFTVDTVLLGIEILDQTCEAGCKLAGIKVFDKGKCRSAR